MGEQERNLCKQILQLDKTIRFVGIASIEGKLIAQEYREGVQSFLTKEESELSVLQSIIRTGTRKVLEEKVGKTIYAFALYEKVKRASMPLGDSNILMVSFDIEANHEDIILNKILPLVSKERYWLTLYFYNSNYMHAEEYHRPDYNEMLSTVYSLMSKYDVDKVYIDGANPSFIRSLKLQIGEDADYDKVIIR